MSRFGKIKMESEEKNMMLFEEGEYF